MVADAWSSPRAAPVSDAATGTAERWFGDCFGGQARAGVAGAGPGQPDRRAHRLQPGLGAAVRAGPRVTVAASGAATACWPSGRARLPAPRPTCRSPPWRPAPSPAGPPTRPVWPGRCARLGHPAGGRRQPGRRLWTCRRALACHPRPRWSAPPPWRWTGCTGSACPAGTLATLAQRAENDFVGVPSGIMDQSASLLSQAIATPCCWTAGPARPPRVPLDPAADGAGAADRRHRRPACAWATAGYAQRRRECERAAALLGVRIAAGRRQPR